MSRIMTLLVVGSWLGWGSAALAQEQPKAPEKPAGEKAPEEARPKAKEPALPMEALYAFADCAVTGKPLGSMGPPVIKEYDGRQVRFCCDGCPPKFEKDLKASLAKLDERIVKDQLPLYPLETSVVSGKALPKRPVNWVYKNRLVRLAAEEEQAAFLKEPAKFLEALDRAVVEKQAATYPLKDCVVAGDNLEDVGSTTDVVVAGRLVRLCCPDCKAIVRKDPAKIVGEIDAARKKGAPAKPADGK